MTPDDTALADRLDNDAQSPFNRCTANQADLDLAARRLRELGAEVESARKHLNSEYHARKAAGARIAELEAERAWTPITEPLKGNADVLVFQDGMMAVGHYGIGGTLPNLFFLSHVGGYEFEQDIEKPTHYMPLPPPPKVGE